MTIQAQTVCTIENLERYAPYWKKAVPDTPKTRAALIHLFGRKYKFTYEAVPRIRAALGMDDPTVQEEYKNLYGQPLETLFLPAKASAERKPKSAPVEETVDNISIEEIETELEWVHLARGEYLFKQGDVGDCLYVLISGRLRSIIQPENGEDALIRDIGQGDIVGETSLIADVAHPATIYAMRDSELISFNRDSLERLARKYPIFMMHLMQRLARGLLAATRRPAVRGNLRTVALVPASADVPLSDFTHRLASALKKISNPLHLTSQALDEALGEGASQTPQDSADNSRIVGWLSHQESAHDLILYEAEADLSAWTRRCIGQADRVLIVARAASNPEPGQIEAELLGASDPRIAPRQELILLHPDRNRQPVGTHQWLAHRRLAGHYHLALNADADFERLARFLTGKAIGLVFSGGGHLGFVHLGVIRALEEAGIAADVVGGTSVGALVGAGYALGWPSQKILEYGKEIAAHVRSYLDFTLPIVSIISAGKLNKLLQSLFGEINIEDLWINYFCISSNLTCARMMIHQRGLLWRYLRASVSLPTFMPPILDKGEILVDGSLFNNLPADVMSQMGEGGPVIAINISPKRDLPREYNFADSISAQQLLWSRFNPLVEELKAPSLVNIISRTMMITGRTETWPQEARDIDLYLEPPLDDYRFGDIAAIDPMVEVGYQAALEKIETWQSKLRNS